MIRLEYEQTVQLLKEAVHKMGEDYVYPHANETCMYFEFEDRAPSCIVGHVLAQEGMTYMDVRGINTDGVISLIESRVIEPADERVTDLLGRVQTHQDNGLPWGEALDKAIAYAGET